MTGFHDLECHINAYVTQLAYDSLAHFLEVGVGAGRAGHVYREAIRVAGLGQEFLGLVRIVAKGLDVAVAQFARRHVARGRLGKAVEQGIYDGIHVHGVVHGLSDFGIQGRLVQASGQVVEGDVPDAGLGILDDLDVFHAQQALGLLRTQAGDDVYLAGLDGGHAGGGLGDGPEDHGLDLGRSPPVVEIGFHGDVVTLDPLDELVGTGTNRVLGLKSGGDHRPSIGHVGHKEHAWLRRGDLDSIFVNLFHRLGLPPLIAIFIVTLDSVIPGKDDRIGVKGLTVVESDAFAQMEGVLGTVLGDIPTLGQRGLDLIVIVQPNQ